LCNEENLKNVTISGDDIVVATNGATIIEGIFEENTQYAIQAQTKQKTSGTYTRARIVYTDGTGDDILLNSSTDYALKSSVSALNKTINKITSYGGNNFTFKKGTFQIEKGSTVTNYIAHAEQDLSFPLAQGQKLMEGDYLADDGIHHKSGQYVFTGTETFTRDKELTNSYRFYTPSNTIPNSVSGTSISTYFKNSSVNSISNIDEEALTVINGNQITLRINKTVASTVQELQTWLAQKYADGNPLIVQYTRLEETIEAYTEEQQIAWEEIKKARTYKNVTHISSEDETPANVDIVYVRDLETVINNLS
jgi:hypothetical protein